MPAIIFWLAFADLSILALPGGCILRALVRNDDYSHPFSSRIYMCTCGYKRVQNEFKRATGYCIMLRWMYYDFVLRHCVFWSRRIIFTTQMVCGVIIHPSHHHSPDRLFPDLLACVSPVFLATIFTICNLFM
jgi:hypothetical protein